MGRLIDLEKDVLGEVLGLGQVADGAVNQVHYRLLELVHQFVKASRSPRFTRSISSASGSRLVDILSAR